MWKQVGAISCTIASGQRGQYIHVSVNSSIVQLQQTFYSYLLRINQHLNFYSQIVHSMRILLLLTCILACVSNLTLLFATLTIRDYTSAEMVGNLICSASLSHDTEIQCSLLLEEPGNDYLRHPGNWENFLYVIISSVIGFIIAVILLIILICFAIVLTIVFVYRYIQNLLTTRLVKTSLWTLFKRKILRRKPKKKTKF